jgi:hypothetical protein
MAWQEARARTPKPAPLQSKPIRLEEEGGDYRRLLSDPICQLD